MSIATLPSPLLTAEQAAKLLGTTAATLAVWRCRRTVQIPHIKLGKAIRYKLDDLECFIASRTVGASQD